MRLSEQHFTGICESNAFCGTKLTKEIKEHGSLTAVWEALYKTLDVTAPGKHVCADLVRQMAHSKDAEPSHTLRTFLSGKVTKLHERVVIPAIIHRLSVRRAQDVTFLRKYFGIPDQHNTKKPAKHDMKLTKPTKPHVYDQVQETSSFLGMLIRASEMWTTPPPSWVDEMSAFENGLLSVSMAYTLGMYCMLRGNFSDPACENLVTSNPGVDFKSLKTLPFVYKPDRYWKQFAKIPVHASAMVITGGLDFQTVREWGRAEYENLSGGDKILIEFENGGHCSGLGATTYSDTSKWGVKMIASYVLNSGRVDKVDTKCMANLPAFSFADLEAMQQVAKVESADELYDSIA